VLRNIRKYNLLFIILCIALQSISGQDSLVVTGKIFAGREVPLKDVSVSVEGRDVTPVLTDEDGVFTITVPSGNEWLILNPVGIYKGKRVFLNNRQTVVISLAEEEMKSGYDDVDLISHLENRRDIISSFTDIDLNRIRQKNIVSIDQAFQGTVPGMFTTSHSGMPGQGTVSFLRGIKSMNTSNAPLFIVDGMPIENPGLFESSIDGNSFNPLSTIDPSDISSVTILKDPIFTSLYGMKGSDGVILIQTLQPKSTQTSINFSLQSGFNFSPDNLIPQLNNEQYKSLVNEILTSSPLREETFKEKYPGLYVTEYDAEYARYMHNTIWQNLIFTNSMFYNAYLSISGGSEISTHGLSVGYHNQKGIFDNTGMNRFNVRFVSNLNVFSWFKINVLASLTNTNSSLKESALSPETSPIMTALSKPPILNPYAYDDEGQKLTILDEVDELGTSNPLAVVKNFTGDNKNYRFISSIKGQADISNTMKWNTLVGINFNTLKEYVFMPNKGMETYYFGEADNVSRSANNQIFSFYNDNYLSFKQQYNSIHGLNTSLGFRIHTNNFQADLGEAKNLPKNDQYSNLQSGQSDFRRITGDNGIWNWFSVYNHISYKFKDKYILNSGLSADFSTRTGKDAETAFNLFGLPFGLFYSIGAGWRISDEFFLNHLQGLENLLLRVSYGATGNDDIGNYNALNYYTQVRYRETSGLIPGPVTNTTLKYEKVRHLNLGLDLSLWGGRTSFTVNYFNLLTEDMLVLIPQEGYTGYMFKPENSGNVKNTGFEIMGFHRIIDKRVLKWDISPVLTFLSNEVTQMNGRELITPFEGGEFVTREGNPVNSFYGYQFEGVFETSENALEANLVNEKGIPFRAGDARYKDFSGPDNTPDGIINDYDKIVLGSPNPSVFGSLLTSLKFHRWSLDMMVQFVYGNEIFNYVRYRNERMIDLSNQSTNVLNRWQYEGQMTDVPRALWNDPVGNSDFSSRWIENGSYMRLKYLTLCYTIPDNFHVFKNAALYITATNLFTWNEYLGYDPEFSYSVDPMEQGIDYGLMPQFRQFLFGIRFGL
jgi:TonB-linked SusC/RagA family outer membrane protein